MGQVTVRVNGYAHTIGCKDGEEAHVYELVGQIENKAKLIRSMGGQFSEARMLLHVALLLADEAGDLKAEVARLSAIAAGAASVGANSTDPRIADRLARIAERIESLAGAIDPQPAAGGGGGRSGGAPPPAAAAAGSDAPAAGRG